MRMTIFPLGINDTTKDSGGKKLFHREEIVMKTRCFEHCVNQSLVLLAAFEEPFGVLDISTECGNCSSNMLAMLHTKDSVLGVGWSIRGTIDGFD
jgi:hypothetical protein